MILVTPYAQLTIQEAIMSYTKHKTKQQRENID